ncbi:MAG: hypothetical protein C5B49_07920 [Bdellovibrio sp.]|nr:MAG: hypothetical protein C5B49_07920 [Bdellovibrio sp.]
MKFKFVFSILGSFYFVLNGCATNKPNALTTGSADPEHSPSVIEYVVKYESPSTLEVQASFAADSSGTTAVVLPAGMYERDKRYEKMSDLRLAGNDVKIDDPGHGNSISILSPPDKLIHLSYKLSPRATQGGFEADFPTINDTYVHFNGSMLLHPERFATISAHVIINWDLPKKWTLANSYGSEKRRQEFEGNFGKTSIGNIYDTVFVAGDFRVYSLDIFSHSVVFAVRGNWKFSDKELTEVVRKVIAGQRTFWNDFDEPYYFAALVPNGKVCCRIGGHGLTQSFSAYLSERDQSLDRFTHVLSHEHFHHWTGEKIAPEAWEQTYWFTEGFTEYYSWKINLMIGILNYEDFVDAVNTAIYKYYSSDKRLATNVEAGNGMNKEGAYTVLNYYRGMLVASEWDAEIRRKSHGAKSLHDLMLSLYDETGKSGKLLTNAIVEKVFAEYVGTEAKTRFENDVVSGKLIRPSDDALGPCAHVVDKKINRYDLGFVNGPTKISKLNPNGNGYAAGLRDGQEILDEKFKDFVPWDPVSLQVRDQAGARWITYYSVTGDTIEMPMYIVDRKDPDRCKSWYQ